MAKSNNCQEILNTPIAVGSDINMQPVTKPLSEFSKFAVGMLKAEDSSAFVLSLCNQLNLQIGDQTIGRAPWKYTPYREQIKDVAIVCLGIVSTVLGNFTVVIECRNKKMIDNIYFYSINGAHNLNRDKLGSIVEDAVRLRFDTHTFVYRAKLCFKVKDLEFAFYAGDNFKIFAANKDSFLEFQVKAIDQLEANDLARQKLSLFCHFMALDSNLVVSYTDFEQIEAPTPHEDNPKMRLYPPFIDGYPVHGKALYLTEKGAYFINEYIFTERNVTDNVIANNLLAASAHVYEGLSSEAGLESEIKFVGRNYVISTVPVNYKSQDLCTKSIMAYMSAVEIATLSEGTLDTCETCGADLYHITARVKDIAVKYLSDEPGKIFSHLYSMRSKYLHAGIYSTGFDQGHPRPVFDPESPNLLVPRGFITIKRNGRTYNLHVTNVREWTTFVLRAYLSDTLYNEKIDINMVPDDAGTYFPVSTKSVRIESAIPGLSIEDITIS